MTTTRGEPLQDLLTQERWVGRLAAALTGDPDDADDLVQAARVALWQRPPKDPSRLRGWLRVLLRNTVLNSRRQRARQSARALAAQLEQQAASADPETLLVRLRWHQCVTQLVATLEEPFRQTILMRYFEGKSSAEISTALGVPAGTVRWRLKTGLDQLRSRLDEQPGGHARWHEALCLISIGPRGDGMNESAESPIPIGDTEGRLRPNRLLSRVWLGLTAVAVIVLWMGTKSTGWSPLSATAISEYSRDRFVAVAATQLTIPPRLLQSTDGPTGEDLAIPLWAQDETKPGQIVAGRVVSEGHPVAGARVRLSLGEATFARHLDRHTRTGADGRFSFGIQVTTNWFLTVSAAGRAQEIRYVDLRMTPVRVNPGSHPANDITVQLEPCEINVRGSVRDESGEPILGATLRITHSWNNGGEPVNVDSQGAFELCSPTQEVRETQRILVAQAAGYGTIETRLKELPGRFDIKLAMAARISGQVLSAATRGPLGGARVTAHPIGTADPNRPPVGTFQAVRLETLADGEGRFELSDLAAGSYELRVGALSGYAPRGSKVLLTIEEGEQRAGVNVSINLGP